MKEAAIQAFIDAGYPLTPVAGKVPINDDWQKTKPGQHKLEELMRGNYGVVLTVNDLVIDIDPRHFKPGDAPLKRLLKDIDAPLKSFTVRTGGGGGHIYLSNPDMVAVVNALKEYPGIEFKSAGRQVVGPGSIHPDTMKEYTIHSGDIGDVAFAPPKLILLIKRPELLKDDEAKGKKFDYQDDPLTQSRFIEFLEQRAKPSVEGEGGDDNAFRVAAAGRDYALSPQMTFELMMEFWNPKCSPAWSSEDLKSKVEHAYKYASKTPGNAHPNNDFEILSGEENNKKIRKAKWKLNKITGLPLNCFTNVLAFLREEGTGLQHLFGYNLFTRRSEFVAPAPWHEGKLPSNPAVTDNDLHLLRGYLAERYKFEASLGDILAGVINVAHDKKYHPVRDYLDRLVWDGVPRIDTWLIDRCGAEDTPYVRACGRKVLCAAVMRIMCPGCKFDQVLLLEGDQGVGKSTVCKILAGEWSCDAPIDPHHRDTIQLMQGKWIMEVAELEFSRRSELEAIKAFITREKDVARLAFGRLTEEFERQSILIGTKNPGSDGTYLKDDTGNRRWWPVLLQPESGKVDFQGLKDNRDQYFAEALVKVRGGEQLFMDTDELEDEAKEVANKRQVESSWVEPISSWLGTQTPIPTFLTGREIYLGAIGGSDRSFLRKEQLAIAASMRSLGWFHKYHRVPQSLGKPRLVRGYRPPKAVEQQARWEAANDPIAEIL